MTKVDKIVKEGFDCMLEYIEADELQKAIKEKYILTKKKELLHESTALNEANPYKAVKGSLSKAWAALSKHKEGLKASYKSKIEAAEEQIKWVNDKIKEYQGKKTDIKAKIKSAADKGAKKTLRAEQKKILQGIRRLRLQNAKNFTKVHGLKAAVIAAAAGLVATAAVAAKKKIAAKKAAKK